MSSEIATSTPTHRVAMRRVLPLHDTESTARQLPVLLAHSCGYTLYRSQTWR